MVLASLCFFIPIFLLIGVGAAYNKLLKIEYEQYRDEWESDGMLPGFGYMPEGAKRTIQSAWARNHQLFHWLVKSPNWSKNNKEARKYLFLCRFFILAFAASIIIIGEFSLPK
jgi:hypothetical protein